MAAQQMDDSGSRIRRKIVLQVVIAGRSDIRDGDGNDVDGRSEMDYNDTVEAHKKREMRYPSAQQ